MSLVPENVHNPHDKGMKFTIEHDTKILYTVSSQN
jgi:hypothetical protein